MRNPFDDEAHPFAERAEGTAFCSLHERELESVLARLADLERGVEGPDGGRSGTTILLTAERAGYGKTTLLSRFRVRAGERAKLVRLDFDADEEIGWEPLLFHLMTDLHKEVDPATGITGLDRLARYVFGLATRELISRRQIPCENPERSIRGLRDDYVKMFDFGDQRQAVGQWFRHHFEQLLPAMVRFFTDPLDLPAPSATTWFRFLFAYTEALTTGDSRTPLIRKLLDGQFSGKTRHGGKEMFRDFGELLSSMKPVGFVVDELDAYFANAKAAQEIAYMITSISKMLPKTMTIISMNADLWESAFDGKIASAYQDRLNQFVCVLGGMHEEQAAALVDARLAAANVNTARINAFLDVLDLSGFLAKRPRGSVSPRQVIRYCRTRWDGFASGRLSSTVPRPVSRDELNTLGQLVAQTPQFASILPVADAGPPSVAAENHPEPGTAHEAADHMELVGPLSSLLKPLPPIGVEADTSSSPGSASTWLNAPDQPASGEPEFEPAVDTVPADVEHEAEDDVEVRSESALPVEVEVEVEDETEGEVEAQDETGVEAEAEAEVEVEVEDVAGIEPRVGDEADGAASVESGVPGSVGTADTQASAEPEPDAGSGESTDATAPGAGLDALLARLREIDAQLSGSTVDTDDAQASNLEATGESSPEPPVHDPVPAAIEPTQTSSEDEEAPCTADSENRRETVGEAFTDWDSEADPDYGEPASHLSEVAEPTGNGAAAGTAESAEKREAVAEDSGPRQQPLEFVSVSSPTTNEEADETEAQPVSPALDEEDDILRRSSSSAGNAQGRHASDATGSDMLAPGGERRPPKLKTADARTIRERFNQVHEQMVRDEALLGIEETRLFRLICAGGKRFPVVDFRELTLPECNGGRIVQWSFPESDILFGFEPFNHLNYWKHLVEFAQSKAHALENNGSRRRTKLVVFADARRPFAVSRWLVSSAPNQSQVETIDTVELDGPSLARIYAAEHVIREADEGLVAASPGDVVGDLATDIDFFWRRITQPLPV